MNTTAAVTGGLNTQGVPAPGIRAIAASPGKVSPPFNPKFASYTLLLDHTQDHISLTIDTGDAPLRIDGRRVESNKPAGPFPIRHGQQTLLVEVLDAQGQVARSYRLFVRRDLPMLAWEKVADTSPWPARDSAGELVFDDAMWLFGGYTPKVVSDVWRSRDGVNWEAQPDIPDAPGVNVPIRFVLAGKMWLVTNNGQYLCSGDGQSWEKIDRPMPWQPRVAAGSVIHAGKAWVMGGYARGKRLNDVWSSADGLNWKLETAAAAWSPRQLHDNVQSFRGRLWVVGGGIQNYHPFKAYRDVWSSEDGIDWRQETDLAPWVGRYWASTAVYADRLWLFGGFRTEPVWENRGDVWYTADGCTWHELKTPAAWSARHEISPYVYKGRLWVVGGNAWPLLNDVWSLQIKGLTFLTSPSVNEFTGCQYTYHARADFNPAATAVRYRLLEAPAWLKVVDEVRGVIQGMAPEVAGDHAVTLEAYDDAGQSARQSFTIHVQEG